MITSQQLNTTAPTVLSACRCVDLLSFPGTFSLVAWHQAKPFHFLSNSLLTIYHIIRPCRYFVFQCTRTPTSRPGRPHCRGSTITLRHTTLGKITLDEWSARRSEVCLTIHDTSQETDIHSQGRIRTEQSQQARGGRPTSLDRAATC
jgi:hypothetical protein